MKTGEITEMENLTLCDVHEKDSKKSSTRLTYGNYKLAGSRYVLNCYYN